VLTPSAAAPPAATIFAIGMPGANGLALHRRERPRVHRGRRAARRRHRARRALARRLTTQSDGNRRDNSPSSGGEAGPGHPYLGKISCLDQRLQVPGLPLID
jgi:hypothetical protein